MPIFHTERDRAAYRERQKKRLLERIGAMSSEERKEYHARHSVQRKERDAKRRRVCQLVDAGMTWDAIASEMGWKLGHTASKVWRAAMRDAPKATLAESRFKYESRMEGVIRRAYALGREPKATIRDRLEANSQVADVCNAMAKVLGFAEPTQHRVGGAKGAPPVTA